ncbi:MAG: 30S ribosomal protein S2 [Candidatus Levybacteria bacterium]|nr:30S ribosomal protein S2 [Candidatus Levybacteria bacterium]
MREITLEELLEAGCHFGHQVTRQNPRAREFIYEARDNIHIIDLAKTKEGLEAAGAYVRDLSARGGSFVVVGTKRQAQNIVLEEIKRARSSLRSLGQAGSLEQIPRLYYVTNRWVGGILTNFSEVAKNYKKLKDLAARLKNDDEKAKYTKKEIGLWEKERAKLESFYGGVSTMEAIPDALFIVDTHFEHLAVQEGQKMGVTTVGVVDTNADPSEVDYVIPANDDAVGSLKLIIAYIMDAFIEGGKLLKQGESHETREIAAKDTNEEELAKDTKEEIAKKEAASKPDKKSVKNKTSAKKRAPRSAKSAA